MRETSQRRLPDLSEPTEYQRRQRLTVAPAEGRRDFRTETLEAGLAIVGGGLAGTCAAITAARAGVRVALVQDRPLLGGNSSSEVRLWILGATAHLGNNNRWAREGGVIDEILVENTYRNPDGNPLIFDTILLEKVVQEPNINLLLNTALVDVEMADDQQSDDHRSAQRISRVTAFCSQNSTRYDIGAELFLDSSGDGALAFLAGASFRMGAEPSSEFGELRAPEEEFGDLLGHSMYFYSKDVGHPVRFVPPSYALANLDSIPRARSFNTAEDGCRLWWIEWGGRLDTVHETETIKWKLWQVVYGVWNHLKNSGEFPEAENLTLEWVGQIPGKRESRRFEGLYMLRQQDIIDQVQHPDAVAFGGWSIDLHPADGVFSEKPGSHHLHARGTYGIPYRCLVSRDVGNLFLAGRIMSASHVAFGSTRVMATGAHCGQAVAIAAALCLRDGLLPRDVVAPNRMVELQRELLRRGQHIPQHVREDPDDLARAASVRASTEFALGTLPDDGMPVTLDVDRGQLLPLPAGKVPQFGLLVDVNEPTTLHAEIRRGTRADDYTPDQLLGRCAIDLDPGEHQQIKIDFDAVTDEPAYTVLCLLRNEDVSVHTSRLIVTGLIPLRHKTDQIADDTIGQPGLEFWTPVRRTEGRNLALSLEPPSSIGSAASVTNGIDRPTDAVNAWVASPDDRQPELRLAWDAPQSISRVEIVFDTDYDHAMESVLLTHPESAMPQCVRDFTISADGLVLVTVRDHHQSRYTLTLPEPITTRDLVIAVQQVNGNAPAAIFTVACYADPDSRILK